MAHAGSDAALGPNELREMFGEPMPLALKLELPELDQFHKTFIAQSPFLCVASCDADGNPTVSPKGDEPGFVKVIDDRTLLLPDRPGNNKIQTLTRVAAHETGVALLFMVPGVRETLRVEGSAAITMDPDHLALGEAGGKVPKVALLITVTKAYFHCGKALIRSHLWDSSRHVPAGTVPSLGTIIREEARMKESVTAVDEFVEEEYVRSLY